MDNITTAKQILAVVKDTGAKLIKLQGIDGNIVVTGNTNKISLEQRAKEMEKLLQSSYMPDGCYHLQIFQNTKSIPTNIPVWKGNPANANGNTERVTIAMSENTKNEISALNEKIEKLQQLITANNLSDGHEEEEEEEEEEPENKFSWLKDCFTAILPAIDKHYELSERKIQLAEKTIANNQSEPDMLELTISMLQKIDDQDKAQQALTDLQKSNLTLYNRVLNWYKQNQNKATNEGSGL
jgi:hypothetical protein